MDGFPIRETQNGGPECCPRTVTTREDRSFELTPLRIDCMPDRYQAVYIIIAILQVALGSAWHYANGLGNERDSSDSSNVKQ